jgi:hypothetical protein
MPIGNVLTRESCANTSAKMNSFQVVTKAYTTIATTPGSDSGSVMRKSTPMREQPSITAASSSSAGIARK